MSLRPGLLASTSRIASVGLRPAASPAVAHFVRAQSTATGTRNPKTGHVTGTVQDLDEQLKQREKQMAAALPKGVDMSTQFDPVILEPIVDPPNWLYKYSWLLSPNAMRKYMWNRFQRNMGSHQHTELLINDGLVPWSKVSRLTSPQKALKGQIEDWNDMYKKLNDAQGKGKIQVLPSLACGPALKRAHSVARGMARNNGVWELVKDNKPPIVQWVRYVPLMSADGPKLAQVAVTFDTTQAITTGSGAKRSRQEKRVVENVIFERFSEAGSPWRIKNYVETHKPTLEPHM